MDSSSDDDENEAGLGPLDHLPDVKETAPGASATGLESPGGGGEGASRLAIACPGAKADTPEIRASGKRVVSPMGLMVDVERVSTGATQPPRQRVEGVLEPDEGRPVSADTGAVPLSPPPPLLRTRDAVRKLLCPRLSRKCQAEAPALAPRKALKVSTSSAARWVVDTQTAIQRGTALARADPKEPVAQGEATKAATKQAGEEAPMPREAKAHESDEAEAPSVAEATEGEAKAPRTSKAEVAEAGASRASEAEVTNAEAPRTTEAEVAEAGASRTTEAKVAEAGLGVAEPAAQDARTEAGQASEVADAEAANTAEQPALTSGEGSSALVRVRPKPYGWDSSRVLWRSRDDPEGEPLFALKDAAEEGHWGSFEQFHHLAEQSLRTALSVVADDLPGARGPLLSARSAEVEDLCLRCADIEAEVATAREQAAPLAAWIKELEEKLTRVAGERDTFRSQAEQGAASAKAIAGQLGAEQGAHLLTKGLKKEASRAAEASVVVQAVLEAEIQEYNTLQSATRTACKALEVGGSSRVAPSGAA
ncbi:uncharacterized protein [Miscanthus floridulus]|uniref:uncharacterized protein n=1 Tax=Miscanthus floridulus TaxID=154761 RepID=UPI003459FAC6